LAYPSSNEKAEFSFFDLFLRLLSFFPPFLGMMLVYSVFVYLPEQIFPSKCFFFLSEDDAGLVSALSPGR